MVAVIVDCCRPPADSDHAALKAMPFLTHEMLANQASPVAHEFDKVAAFNKVYLTREEWVEAVPGLTTMLSNPDLVRLTPAMFYESENYSTRGSASPPELAFLLRTNLLDLLPAEPVALGACSPLARATLLAGSKDTRAERSDDAAPIRIVMEIVLALLLRHLRRDAASDAGLARAFCTLVDQLHLPAAFSQLSVTTWHACDEFQAAFTHSHGTTVEVVAVEKPRLLRAPRVYEHLRHVLSRFGSAADAWVELDRMFMALVVGSSATTPTLTKLAQLDALFDTAAWRAIITHAVSANPGIDGSALVTTLVQSHTSVVTTTGAAPATFSGGTPASANGDSSSYGSVRAASVADALRLDGAREALEQAASLSGVERVEVLLQADSVLLKRAELFQEPWLLNSVAALSSCSLDEPYLRPYISQVLCEDDDSGEVPVRLKGYLIDDTIIPTLRSGKWSKLPIVEIALEIRSMLTGATFLPVKDSEKYIVAASLDLVAEYGPKLFFSFGVSLSPQKGKSFEEGIVLQKKAVTFAQTLPEAERAEWLAFLNKGFLEFLDAGGALNVSKFKTGRPELDEARIDEFAPEDTAFFVNTEARLLRAEPIADLRVAFPSLLGAKAVALPGTSPAGSSRNLAEGDEDVGKGKNKNKNKNKKDKGKRPVTADGPGSKSHYALVLSDTELFHSGMVFLSEDIREEYKLKDDACLPVLLSKKKGDAALEICPDADNHGGMNQACHKRPSNFNLEKIYKDHTRKPTAKELKFANWAPGSKTKK